MKKLFVLLSAVFYVSFLQMPTQAGELDILLDKLVDKGVLSPVEATIIKDETKQQVSAEVEDGKSYAVPSWVQNMKLKGDFRLRYQYEKRDTDEKGRTRGRLRYRLGIVSDVVKNVEVGMGLASGGDDPRSTNQTFDDAFSTGDIRLDLAYAQYTPNKNISLIGGKFARKDYLWATTDLLWDGDINPEGVSLHAERELTDSATAFLNTGVWVMEDIDQTDSTDPFLHYFQGGISAKAGNVDAKLAGIYYGFNGLQGASTGNNSDLNIDGGSNTRTTQSSGGMWVYDYDAAGVSAEVGIKEPLGLESVERLAFFGDFINNVSNGVTEDQGWAAGVKFGSKKVAKPNTWQLKYVYADLDKDAFPDVFPDSDRFGGKTNIKGHEGVIEYAIKNNVIVGLDYYNTNRKDNDDKEHLVQADINFKF